MNTPASQLPRKSIIVLVMLSVALICLVPRQKRLAEASRTLAEAQRHKVELQLRVASVTATRDSVRQELRKERRALEAKRAAVVEVEQELAGIAPDTRWTSPPATEPQWDDNSPYIWISKTMLPKLPGSPFTDNAELRDEVAATLALDTAPTHILNEKLAALLAQYRALEAAHAERIDEPLPGIANDGPQVTVRVIPFPNEGELLKQQFRDTLCNAIGQQRAQLVIEAAAGWLESQFAASGALPKTISVVRHPNGTYNLSMRTGSSWFSTGGFRQLSDYLPEHLLPLFSEELQQSAQSQ